MPNYFYYEATFKESSLTLKGNSFTQISGKGKGRNIWFEKEKTPPNFVLIPGKSYIIKCERDLDKETIESKDRKLNNFFFAEITWFESY